ncbi:transmembrane family 220 helix protein [Tasmannia lanceolata]|uniref:transmembrane family 220 helix protein n=1 Tax=Tasmannia lanceolata TaxID=3420 RepID=UPI004063CB86
MAIPSNRSYLFTSFSILMVSLFAYSATVQLNDPDWYLWFPLYSIGSAVNLLNISFPSKTSNQMAKLAFGVGILLFLKVVIEGYMYGLAGIWSLDMGERVVREKTGSGLVVASMFLQLKASAITKDPNRRKRDEIGRYLECGMALLLVVSFGLSLAFFVLVKEI